MTGSVGTELFDENKKNNKKSGSLARVMRVESQDFHLCNKNVSNAH